MYFLFFGHVKKGEKKWRNIKNPQKLKLYQNKIVYEEIKIRSSYKIIPLIKLGLIIRVMSLKEYLKLKYIKNKENWNFNTIS